MKLSEMSLPDLLNLRFYLSDKTKNETGSFSGINTDYIRYHKYRGLLKSLEDEIDQKINSIEW